MRVITHYARDDTLCAWWHIMRVIAHYARDSTSLDMAWINFCKIGVLVWANCSCYVYVPSGLRYMWNKTYMWAYMCHRICSQFVCMCVWRTLCLVSVKAYIHTYIHTTTQRRNGQPESIRCGTARCRKRAKAPAKSIIRSRDNGGNTGRRVHNALCCYVVCVCILRAHNFALRMFCVTFVGWVSHRRVCHVCVFWYMHINRAYIHAYREAYIYRHIQSCIHACILTWATCIHK